LKDYIYLIVSKGGIDGTRKTHPSLRSGQFAVKVSVSIDDRFFKQIVPEAHIDIGEEFLIEPEVEVAPEADVQVMGGELGPP